MFGMGAPTGMPYQVEPFSFQSRLISFLWNLNLKNTIVRLCGDLRWMNLTDSPTIVRNVAFQFV